VEKRGVKITAALHGVTRLFLDTAPVIYYVERNPVYSAVVDEIFDRIDTATVQAVTSPVTLAECLVIPIKKGLGALQQDFADLIVSGANVTFVSLGEAVARRAAELRANYNLRLADALQIATALVATCDAFLTNDAALKVVKDLPILLVKDLEL
jgi:predicted nucleic acid-binding protein